MRRQYGSDDERMRFAQVSIDVLSLSVLTHTTTDQRQNHLSNILSRTSSECKRGSTQSSSRSKSLTRSRLRPVTDPQPVPSPAGMSYEVQKQVLVGHASDVNCVDFSHSDVLVSGSNDKSLRIWLKSSDGTYAESKDPVSPFTGHKYGVNCVRFSPFDTIIASGSTDGNIVMWNAKVVPCSLILSN